MNLEHTLKHKSINNTGFDNTTGHSSGRVLNKDGSSNVVKSGIPYLRRVSLFHTLINMHIVTFILVALAVFVVINLFFGCIYYLIGVDQIGIKPGQSSTAQFLECFFFSAQTVTTVGYGIMHPQSIATNALSTFESVFGWMAFAVLTGLIYGRFAKPKAYLMFSNNAVIGPYKDGQGLMFRMAPYKNNTLTEAEVLLNITFRIHENDKIVNKFLPLKAELSKISALSLNWTVVHYIDEESPLYGMCKEDYEINETELMVFVKAFDEHFSNTVQQRTSYDASDIIHGAKFAQMFRQSDDKTSTILELDKIHDYHLIK
ncbi:ATP-sensitive inward rectifier potassium channel 15 [Filimonas sp.]|jgi:inward rectifier potassium channel|nr:ATP-sensitive inward rectifier potassium channel 15 [Filimonas sp.]